MPWRAISSDRIGEMTAHALASRHLLRPEHPVLHIFDNTCLVFRDGWLNSGCGLEPAGPVERVFQYEWSDEHQAAFQSVLAECAFDHGMLERAVADLGWHWDKIPAGLAMLGQVRVPWLEPFAAGVSEALHNLGKTPLFRSLTTCSTRPSVTFFLSQDSEGKFHVDLQDGSDERVTLPAAERASMMATRGMAQYVGAHFDMPPDPRKTCVLCDEEFWPQALDATDLARFGAPRYCSLCLNSISNRVDPWVVAGLDEHTSRQGALDAVHVFHQLTGIYPTSAAKKPYVGHADDATRDNWVVACMLLAGKDTVKRHFGDWRAMLAAADVLDEMPRKGHSGYVSVAADGHVALSNAEQQICNFLFQRGVPHDKEPLYPFDPELNPNTALRADWKVADLFVEFAGRMDDKKYAANIERKRALAARHNVNLLVLHPTDLRKLELVAQRHGW